MSGLGSPASLARRAWHWEGGVWVSLYRWLRRSDPAAHPEAERFIEFE